MSLRDGCAREKEHSLKMGLLLAFRAGGVYDWPNFYDAQLKRVKGEAHPVYHYLCPTGGSTRGLFRHTDLFRCPVCRAVKVPSLHPLDGSHLFPVQGFQVWQKQLMTDPSGRSALDELIGKSSYLRWAAKLNREELMTPLCVILTCGGCNAKLNCMVCFHPEPRRRGSWLLKEYTDHWVLFCAVFFLLL